MGSLGKSGTGTGEEMKVYGLWARSAWEIHDVDVVVCYVYIYGIGESERWRCRLCL